MDRVVSVRRTQIALKTALNNTIQANKKDNNVLEDLIQIRAILADKRECNERKPFFALRARKVSSISAELVNLLPRIQKVGDSQLSGNALIVAKEITRDSVDIRLAKRIMKSINIYVMQYEDDIDITHTFTYLRGFLIAWITTGALLLIAGLYGKDIYGVSPVFLMSTALFAELGTFCSMAYKRPSGQTEDKQKLQKPLVLVSSISGGILGIMTTIAVEANIIPLSLEENKKNLYIIILAFVAGFGGPSSTKIFDKMKK